MELITDSEKKKVYIMEGNVYNIEITLTDWGSYIGHENRPFGTTPTPKWLTSYIKVNYNEDEGKNLNAEFFYNSKGSMQSLLIKDKNGNTRNIIPIYKTYGFNDEELEHHYGKGIHNVIGPDGIEMLVQDMYVEGPLLHSTTYYFNKSTSTFIDDEGNTAPNTVLTNLDLGKTFVNAAHKISEQFRQKDPNSIKLDDIGIGSI